MKASQQSALKDLNASIREEKDKKVRELSAKVEENPQNIKHYLEAANIAMSKGQTALHSSLVDKFDELLAKKSRILAESPIFEKGNFITNYMIEPI